MAATGVAGGAAAEEGGGDPLAALEVTAKGPGWDGIRLGMSFVQAERRAGTTLPLTERPGARCGSFVTGVDHRGLILQLGFTGPKPGDKVETLFVRFEGYQVAATTADLVASLRRKAPTATYRPDPEHASAEAEDPAPVYVVENGGDPWAVQLRPRDGILIARRECLR